MKLEQRMFQYTYITDDTVYVFPIDKQEQFSIATLLFT